MCSGRRPSGVRATGQHPRKRGAAPRGVRTWARGRKPDSPVRAGHHERTRHLTVTHIGQAGRRTGVGPDHPSRTARRLPRPSAEHRRLRGRGPGVPHRDRVQLFQSRSIPAKASSRLCAMKRWDGPAGGSVPAGRGRRASPPTHRLSVAFYGSYVNTRPARGRLARCRSGRLGALPLEQRPPVDDPHARRRGTHTVRGISRSPPATGGCWASRHRLVRP